MIIKSITAKVPRFKQLLDYLTKDQEKIINQQGESFVLKQNLYGRTNAEMARKFLQTEGSRLVPRRSNSNRLIHEILSFSDLDRDRITIEHLKVLTEEYLSKRSPLLQGYAIGHFSTEDHVHVHIILAPVDTLGRSLRMSQEQFATIKRELQEFQIARFPELSQSTVRHGRKAEERKQGRESQKEYAMNLRSPSPSNKARAREAIESSMLMAESKEDFYRLLELEGFKPYQKGISDDGNRNYRFAALINDYSERFEALDQKQENLEELRDIRESKQDRVQEYNFEQEDSLGDDEESARDFLE